MADLPNICTVFWQYSPLQRIHYLFAVRHFDQQFEGIFAPIVQMADDLGGCLSSYILDTLKQDYVQQASQVSELVAIRIDFQSDGSNVQSRLMTTSTTKDENARKLRDMMLDFVDLELRKLAN